MNNNGKAGDIDNGNLFGIVATQSCSRTATAQDPFPGRTAIFRQIALAAKQHDLDVCIFTPAGIDRRHRLVRAFVYAPHQGWKYRMCPLPKVVYNRVANRRAEGRKRVRLALSWLREQGTVIFNAGFLDKWAVYACLQTDPLVGPHVPPTMLYRQPAQLGNLLRDWKMLYCKPRHGSLGNGIVVFHLSRDGRVELMYNPANAATRHIQLAGVEGAVAWARRHFRPEQVCLQHGVSLAQVRGRRFDIRALVQKDANGRWCFTGAACRVAAAGQATTHVPRGGSHLPLAVALRATVHDAEKEQAIRQELASLCEDAARVLEEGLDHLCGEFSLDIALDKSGYLWILEMNAKPFKFDEPGIRRLAYRRLIDYASYLLEQKEE